MDKIEKLIRKISRQDRDRLLGIVERLKSNKLENLDIKKIKNTDFYRVRSGNFRIIFHWQGKPREVIVDSIRIRNEGTY